MGIHWSLELHPVVEHVYGDDGELLEKRVEDFPNGGIELDCYGRSDGFVYLELKDYTGPEGLTKPLSGIGLLNAKECRLLASKLYETARFLEGR